MKKVAVVSLLAGSVLAIDLVSKSVVKSNFAVNEEVVIIKDFFNLSYHQNRGVAFGFLGQLPEEFRVPILATLSLSVMLFLVYQMRTTENLLELVSLSSVLGGALGNLIGRLQLGYVVDFIHLHWKNIYHFPTFNIADIFICSGVAGMLFISSLRNSRKSQA